MNLTRKTYTTRNEKIIDFVIGFIGWFVLNGLLTVLVQAVSAGLSLAGGALDGGGSGVSDVTLIVIGLVGLCVPLLINIGLLVYFALTRYWIALGALAAFALSLVAVICLGVVLGVTCFAALGGFNSAFPTPTP
jgi:hypothetical protein